MEILRKNKIPAIYLTIPWIRNPVKSIWADCQEDIELIHQMKNVCNGNLCLSSFDRLSNYLIKAEFPKNWNEFNGDSDECIYWHFYHWNVWDVLYLIEGSKPHEAVPISAAGIPLSYLDTIEANKSCLPILKELRKSVKYSELTNEMIAKIQKYEEKILSQLKLRQLKGSVSGYISKKNTSTIKRNEAQINGKIKKEVLRRDKYRCVFCGASSEDSRLEVDHIIPRSLIRKICLDEKLYSAKYNLCTLCKSCNREKSDNLHPEDIKHYICLFSQKGHPNIEILPYLNKIHDMQDAKCENT